MTSETTFTPSEAAVVSGVPLQVVHKAIDEGPLESVRERKSHRRLLTEADLLYLAAASAFDPKLVRLSVQAKEHLRRIIATHCRREKPPGKLALFNGLEIDIRPLFSRMRSRAALLDKAKKMVTTSPRVRGGEPVLRGTRIGVYEVAAMIKDASEEELEEFLSGYPTLKHEQIKLAQIYAAAHPRRGRPAKHPWHSASANATA